MLTIPELQAARRPPYKFVHCSRCQKELRADAAIVVATRNCPGCGERVVAEPTENDATAPFTPEQLADARALSAHAKRRAYWMLHVGFLIFLASPFALGAGRDAIRAAVQPVMDPAWVFLLLLFGPCLPFFVAVVVLEHRAARALTCPHCGAPCFAGGPRTRPDLTRLTGNCGNCGRRLVNQPPPGEPAGPLPTVDEFKAAEGRTPFFDWAGVFLYGVLAALLLALATVFAVAQPMQLWADFERRYGRVGAAILAFALFGGYVFAQLALAVIGIRWLARRHMRRREAEPVLNCPHCRAALAPSRLVIAARRCPSCRKRVLADPEPAAVAAEG